MSEKAIKLLKRLASEFDKNQKRSFASVELDYPDKSTVDELVSYGYIIKKNNILGSIELTLEGYEAAQE